MGAIKFRTMEDLARLDAHLRVICGATGCDHTVLYQRDGMISWFRHKKWNTHLDVAGRWFRCSKCGHKGAILRAEALPHPTPPPRPLPLSKRDIAAEIRRRRG